MLFCMAYVNKNYFIETTYMIVYVGLCCIDKVTELHEIRGIIHFKTLVNIPLEIY